MSLPENWDGIFYSKESYGDMLFDLSPEEFLKQPGVQQQGPQFLFAAAIFDLLWNNEEELAVRWHEFAKSQWPDASWDLIEGMVKIGKEYLEQGAPRSYLTSMIYMFLEMAF